MARTARLGLEVDSRGAVRGASSASRELQGTKRSAREATDELRRLTKGANELGGQATQTGGRINFLRQHVDNMHQGFLKARVSAGGLSTSFIALRQAAIVLIAVEVGKKFLEMADATKQMNAQLRLAVGAHSTLAQAQADVLRIANLTRSGLEETNTLYSKVSRQAQQLGKTQESAARFTETFTKTLKISGAGAAESASVRRSRPACCAATNSTR
jgi:hypothetical protein